MGLQDTETIDFAGSDDDSIVLVIFDSFEWNSYGIDDFLDDDDHMDLLTEKINTCLAFWESGQIYERFPDGKTKQVIIRVTGLFERNERATWFYDGVAKKLSELGLAIEFELDADEESVEERREFDDRIRAHLGQ